MTQMLIEFTFVAFIRPDILVDRLMAYVGFALELTTSHYLFGAIFLSLKSDNQMLYHFHDAYPVRANYFEHPEELIFNPNSELIFQVDHIIKENKERFPRSFQNLPNEEIMRRFEGAVEECKKKGLDKLYTRSSSVL